MAYLLFRIADTFEDATHLPPDARIQALHDFTLLLRSPSPAEAARLSREWTAAGWAKHPGYGELIGEISFVLEAFSKLSAGAIDAIREPVVRSADGMASFVSRTRDGRLALCSLDDLKAYCYVVAGLVGEMLTELFLLDRPELAVAAPDLRGRSSTFGEALQLVNILKDAAEDASEGRSYLPAGLPVREVFALARRDLGAAGEYVAALEGAGAPRGLLEFTVLPVELAWATLHRVETGGRGAKVSRLEVFSIVRRVREALDSGVSVAEPLRHR